MLANISDLPDTARVWIYQSNETLSGEQIAIIREASEAFCNQWSAHSTPLHSSFKVLHDKFLILIVDEGVNNASGCSIDSSVRFIKGLEQRIGVNFFDRSQVAFLIDDHIYTTDLNEIKNEISNGKIGADTLTFNLQAESLGDFNSNWLVKVQNSWMKRYF